jgi:UDP-N-acetylglucosamine acyltransferase
MPTIHPSSVIETGATLADDVIVGPLCFVGAKATIGAGTRLVSHVTVLGRTTIGEGNVIWPQAVLGGDPQDLKFKGEDSELIIGDRNQIRESVTIHLGTAHAGNVTQVGSDNLIMIGCHIAHDCIVGNHVVMANSVGLAGHIVIEDHAAIGGFSGFHHFVTIGRHAYVGGASRIVHDVPPYMVVEGNPQRVRGVNMIGLARHGFDDVTKERLKDAWRKLYRHAEEHNGVGATAAAIAEISRLYPDDIHINRLLDAVRNTAAGIHGRYLESLRKDNRYTNPVK